MNLQEQYKRLFKGKIRSNDSKLINEVNEGKVKEASMAVEEWVEQYNRYMGVNGDKLPMGYLQATLNTGIMSDAYEENEYATFNEDNGYKDDSDWQEGDTERFMSVSPITKGMFDTIAEIQKKYSMDEEDINTIIGCFN